MRDFKLILLMLFVASTSLAQQENPRGIFRLTRLTIKNGTTVKAPIDQYKLCGDSACVMITYNRRINNTGNIDNFMMVNSDEKAFNYTGDKSKDEIGVWIYDSYKTNFTLKWYSQVINHPFFPAGGWVTEWYDSTVERSEFANTVINAFRPHKTTNNIEGVWFVSGAQKFYALVYKNKLILFNPSECDYQRQKMLLQCVMMDFSYDGKRYVKYGAGDFIVEWQGDDMFQVSAKDSLNKMMDVWTRAELPPAYKAFFESFKFD